MYTFYPIIWLFVSSLNSYCPLYGVVIEFLYIYFQEFIYPRRTIIITLSYLLDKKLWVLLLKILVGFKFLNIVFVHCDFIKCIISCLIPLDPWLTCSSKLSLASSTSSPWLSSTSLLSTLLFSGVASFSLPPYIQLIVTSGYAPRDI